MKMSFRGEVFCWRGPAPYYFVAVPDDLSGQIEAVSAMVTYGWGVIPVSAAIGDTTWSTALFPKDGLYLVPLRANVRRAEQLEEGDTATIELTVDV